VATRVVFEAGWQRHINGDVHDLLERMGVEIETGAKAACPVRTGWLRDSTEHEVDGGTVRIGNGNDLPYTRYVEEGTRYMAATPFLHPSLFGARSL
jgi:HK97 gp10 family phage protein